MGIVSEPVSKVKLKKPWNENAFTSKRAPGKIATEKG